MKVTKVIPWSRIRVELTRTKERATIIDDHMSNIVTRNTWKDQFGKLYCQYKNQFFELYPSSHWEYDYAMGCGF